MKPQKKVIMNHGLAKALLEHSIQQFDDGGTVSPLATGPNVATTASGNPGFLGQLFGQSNYSANAAPVQYSDYSPLIQTGVTNALAGYNTANGVQEQQQALANALLAQSQGQGPNPALAQLNQTTGQNVANQAALAASVRGASANPGEVARQAALAGTNAEQQATGQAATLAAEQELGAQGQLGNTLNSIQQGNLGEQGMQASLANLGVSGQNAQNTNSVSNTLGAENINAGINTHNANTNLTSAIGGVAGGVASGLTGGILGGGGSSGGGSTGSFSATPTVSGSNPFGLSSNTIGKWKGGKIPDHLQKMASIYHPEFASKGGPVPGKPLVTKNDPKNDTVPAMLTPGEDVLPLSVTKAKDAPQKAYDFVKQLQEEEKKKGGKKEEVSKALHSKKDLKSRVERLEKLFAGGMA